MFKTTVLKKIDSYMTDIDRDKLAELARRQPPNRFVTNDGLDCFKRIWPSAEEAAAYCEFMLTMDGVESAVVDGEVTE